MDGPGNSTGVAFGHNAGEENMIGVRQLLIACRDSPIRLGRITQADPVVGCVLEDGGLGVFPGNDDVCTTLRLPVADAAASAPVPNPNG